MGLEDLMPSVQRDRQAYLTPGAVAISRIFLLCASLSSTVLLSPPPSFLEELRPFRAYDCAPLVVIVHRSFS